MKFYNDVSRMRVGLHAGTWLQNACKSIVMRWRFKSWPSDHYSRVTIELTDSPDGTQLTLRQVGVPDTDADRTQQGWTNYYWQSIRQTFGFAANIM